MISIHLFESLAALLRQGLKLQGFAQITQHVIGVSVAQAMSSPGANDHIAERLRLPNAGRTVLQAEVIMAYDVAES